MVIIITIILYDTDRQIIHNIIFFNIYFAICDIGKGIGDPESNEKNN